MNYNIQTPQDTTKKQLQLQPDLSVTNPVLNVPVTNISLDEVGALRVDSSRLEVPKLKPRPVVKTIPYVPDTGKVVQPDYNLFDQSYDLPKEETFSDQLGFEVVDPELAGEYGQKTVQIQEEKTVSIEQIKEKSSEFKLIQNSGTRGIEQTDWMIGVILVSLFLFAWIRVGYGRFLNALTQAVFNFFAAKRLQEEGNILRSRVFNFVNLLFYINISLFTAQLLDYFNFTFFEYDGISLFFIAMLFWVMVYVSKSIVFLLFDFVFQTKRSFRAYLFNVFIYNKVSGLLLMPIVTIVPFVPSGVTPWLLGAGVVLLVIMYLLSLLRGLQIGFKNRLSIFYMFLYLCALEILPALILIKIVRDYMMGG